MGVAVTGLTRSVCPHCRRVMIGMVHSAYEGAEMACPKCGEWCVFRISGWSPLPWDAKPPDHGKETCSPDAWAAAVAELGEL